MNRLLTLLIPTILTFTFAIDAWAPPVFTVPSGGRGLENAKQAAQISQIHNTDDAQQTSIDTLTTQMAAIPAHAKATMNSCAAGNKILWDGTAWSCVTETDPTVQAFAKSPLPACATGEILKANGTSFSCVSSASAGFEVDPTVYAFAKSVLPSCTSGQVLTGNGTTLSCTNASGTYTETDPTVKSFAQNNLPSCGAGYVLTANGTSLSCVADTSGGFTESDPVTKAFAKATLPTCAAGNALTGNGTSLSCTALGGAGVETDPKVGTLTSTKWCTSDGTKINCTAVQPVLSESDPNVYAFAKNALPSCASGAVLTGNGTALACTSTITASSYAETDPVTKTFAKTTLPTCAAGQVLNGDGTALSCVSNGADNLGNHTATTNINLGANYISYAGTAAGFNLDSYNNATVSGQIKSLTSTLAGFRAEDRTTTGQIGIYRTGGISRLYDSTSGDTIIFNNSGVGIGLPVDTNASSKLQVRTGVNQNVGIEGPQAAAAGNTINVYNDVHNTNVPLEIRSTPLILGMVGNVGIGTINPGIKLDVTSATGDGINGTTTAGGLNVGVKGLGGSYWGGLGRSDGYAFLGIGAVWATGAGSFNQSDGRLKENVRNLGSAVDTLMKLRPVSYQWKPDSEAFRSTGDTRQFGLIAQEVKKVLPEIVILNKNPPVTERKDGTLSLDAKLGQSYGVEYTKLIPFLIEAVQELKGENDKMRAENQQMHDAIEQLKRAVTH